MKKLVVLLLIVAFAGGCATPGKNEIAGAGSDASKSVVYENETVGIRAPLPGGWSLSTTHENADPIFKGFLKKGKSDNESPLFFGANPQKTAYVRCLVEKSELEIDAYFALLREANPDLPIESARRTPGGQTIQWRYRPKSQVKIKFLETMTKQGDYVIRLGCWTFIQNFDQFLPAFREITEKVSFLNKSEASPTWDAPWAGLEAKLSPDNMDGIEIAAPETTAPEAAPEFHSECPEEPRKLFMWEIHGEKNTLYLFGSVHFGRKEFYPFQKEIEEAFENSENLVVEVNIRSDEFKKNARNMGSYATIENNRTIRDVLSGPAYEILAQKLKTSRLSMDGFRNYKPWFISLMLSSMELMSHGVNPEYGVDAYFLKKAAQTKKIIELETFHEQIAIFDEKIDGERFLIYTIQSLEKLGSMLPPLIEAWRCGNAEELNDFIFRAFKDAPDGNMLVEEMFNKRNKKFAEKIMRFLREDENYFIVFGAGHLTGEKGVLSLLAKEGVQARQVVARD